MDRHEYTQSRRLTLSICWIQLLVHKLRRDVKATLLRRDLNPRLLGCFDTVRGTIARDVNCIKLNICQTYMVWSQLCVLYGHLA